MSAKMDALIAHVHGHRCYNHPIFDHWVKADPAPEVVGALFHQIQKFCASTRPGWNLPQALETHGLHRESALLQEIVESEEDHGPQLATMAGHILNRRAGRILCADLGDTDDVESRLKDMSDRIMGMLPDYQPATGLAIQTRKAIQVFDRRRLTDRESTLRNLGTALALEMVSNNHLIPGEKRALIDSGLYSVSMDEPEMYYLVEHYGEIGAEQQHEKNAIAAVDAVLDEETEPLIRAGVDDFLNSLENFWDLLDSALLRSGHPQEAPQQLAVA